MIKCDHNLLLSRDLVALTVCERCETFAAPERLIFAFIPMSALDHVLANHERALVCVCVNITHHAVAIGGLIKD